MGTGDDAPSPAVELEHAVGYSALKGGLKYHPNEREYLFAAGASIIVCDFTDPHQQVFLRGHDSNITCLALSRSGKYIASGQYGENSDAIVWDFSTKRLLYRMSEHDHGVECLAFSDDELLLCTVGAVDDNKVLIWDLSNGYIVTMVQHDPSPTTCVSWGGMVKDIKRRDTANYQLCTGGSQRLVLWSLNPFTGEMVGERVTTEGRGSMVRSISWLEFSDDYETIYCGTSSGDFALVNVKQLKLGAPVAACRLGVLSLLCWPEGLIIGGGDGTVTTFDSNLHDLCQAQLDGAVVAMSFSPDRLEILAGTSKGFVYRLRVENMASLLVCENHAAPVKCVSYAAGTSDRFATISSDCTLRIWDAADYSVLTTVCVRDAGEPSCLVYTLDFLISGARAPPRRGERKRRGVPFITRALLKLSPRPRARRLERRQDPRPRIRHRLAAVAHRQRAPRRRDGARA